MLSTTPDYAGLVRFLVHPFLESPDSLKVDCEMNQRQGKAWIRLAFDDPEKGRVYGRGGRNIHSIRTVLTAIAQSASQTIYLEIYDGQITMGRPSGQRVYREREYGRDRDFRREREPNRDRDFLREREPNRDRDFLREPSRDQDFQREREYNRDQDFQRDREPEREPRPYHVDDASSIEEIDPRRTRRRPSNPPTPRSRPRGGRWES